MSTFGVSGRLLEWHGERGAFTHWESVPGVQLEARPGAGWLQMSLVSDAPLAGEAAGDAARFKYQVLCRASGDKRALLAASHSEVVPALLARVGPAWIARAPGILIPRLVANIVEDPGQYALGAVHARVYGYGRSFRSVSLYGADLGSAGLAKDLLKSLQPYRATLRRVASDQEVLSVGSHGEVLFRFSGAESLAVVDETLRFVSELGFINWRQQFTID